MRRENRSNHQEKSKAIWYGAFALVGITAIIVIALLVVYGGNHKGTKEDFSAAKLTELVPNQVDNEEDNQTAQTSSSLGKNVIQANEMKNEKNENTSFHISSNTSSNQQVNTTTTNAKENTVKTKEKTKKSENKTEKQENKTEDPVFTKPVDGEEMREYAQDKLVYSETLKEWMTHPGIDLKAEKTSVVKAAADGKVIAIKNDPRYGLTVVIEHQNQFKTVYANLLTAEFVTEGEEVKSGQTIGTVGNTAIFEIADEAHLHFEILKNDENVDPNIYIAQ